MLPQLWRVYTCEDARFNLMTSHYRAPHDFCHCLFANQNCDIKNEKMYFLEIYFSICAPHINQRDKLVFVFLIRAPR